MNEVSTDDTTRTETWPCDGAAELDLAVEVGRLELTLTEAASTVEVELRAGPLGGTAWNQGLPGLLSWLGGGTGQASVRVGGRSFPFGGDLDLGELLGRDLGQEAVRAAEVSWSESTRRLVVRSSSTMPLRLVSLVVTVHAPARSRLTLRTGSGDITVTGRAGDTSVRTGSGDLRLDAVDGDAELTTGSGTVSAGAMRGRTRAKTGSGNLSLANLGGPGEVKVGSGTVRLGGVHADLRATTGSGDLLIEDAEAGRLQLSTGSGDLRVGVHAGVTAALDLTSSSGRVRSELDVRDGSPAGAPTLVVHGRTGSGNVLVSRAAS
ncbi:MAG: DUF4097 family beta strand repeat-containing protein [Actinomycetota bacterium]|nr:DUF4097 family beta strand repeat-containing protein [Actinomycetota bacterium]